jgi:hypothetical protein
VAAEWSRPTHLAKLDGDVILGSRRRAPRESQNLDRIRFRIADLHGSMCLANRGILEKTTMGKKSKAPEVPTLKDLCAAYIASIQMDGRSSGTAASYENDLKVATKFFGEDATLLDMTRERIREYFDSPAVTLKRNGEMKNAISIAKTRRILRLALCWAADSGWIGEAPIPVAEDSKNSAAAESTSPADAPTEPTIAEGATATTDAEPTLPSFDHPELSRDEPAADARVAAPKKGGKKKAKAAAAAK